jgi:hypothetical protein
MGSLGSLLWFLLIRLTNIGSLCGIIGIKEIPGCDAQGYTHRDDCAKYHSRNIMNYHSFCLLDKNKFQFM